MYKNGVGRRPVPPSHSAGDVFLSSISIDFQMLHSRDSPSADRNLLINEFPHFFPGRHCPDSPFPGRHDRGRRIGKCQHFSQFFFRQVFKIMLQDIIQRTAAECIDWSIPAQSIFERDKPLAENTMRRIARGIKKFVIDNPNPFIINSGEQPAVAPTLIQYHSEQSDAEVRGQELTEPLMTVDTSPRYALSVAYVMKNYAGGYTGAGSAADEPLDTVTASCSGAHHAEVQAFLVKYFSNGAAKPVDEPLDTVTTRDRFALVTIHGEEYIITDIRMRMLQPRELFNAQGFPEEYIIDRDADGHAYSKTKQVARCGNAVTPPVATALVRANLPEYCEVL